MVSNIILDILKMSKVRENMGPWTPYLLQKYFKKYKKIQIILKTLFFCKSDDLTSWTVLERMRIGIFESWEFWELGEFDFWILRTLNFGKFAVLKFPNFDCWNLKFHVLKIWKGDRTRTYEDPFFFGILEYGINIFLKTWN